MRDATAEREAAAGAKLYAGPAEVAAQWFCKGEEVLRQSELLPQEAELSEDEAMARYDLYPADMQHAPASAELPRFAVYLRSPDTLRRGGAIKSGDNYEGVIKGCLLSWLRALLCAGAAGGPVVGAAHQRRSAVCVHQLCARPRCSQDG